MTTKSLSNLETAKYISMQIKTQDTHLAFSSTWTPSAGPLIILLNNGGGTLVSLHLSMLYFCKTRTRVILISMRANRIPIQFLGPPPNGIHAKGWRLDFLSGRNLQKSIDEFKSSLTIHWCFFGTFCEFFTSMFCYFKFVPFWNTLPHILWTPVLWIHVHSFQIHLDLSSSRNHVFTNFCGFSTCSTWSSTNKEFSNEMVSYRCTV